jgi:hypothetical protein
MAADKGQQHRHMHLQMAVFLFRNNIRISYTKRKTLAIRLIWKEVSNTTFPPLVIGERRC